MLTVDKREKAWSKRFLVTLRAKFALPEIASPGRHWPNPFINKYSFAAYNTYFSGSQVL